ncbi:MAG: hypothetical protein RL021_1119 [Bacteroidota bacterium]|jgi:hypothetical protein
MNNRFRILLYVITAYLTFLGVMFLLAPDTFASMMKLESLPDKVLNILYGQVMLTFAYVGYMAASSGESRVSRALLALTVGHVIVFGYLLGSGMQSFEQVGPPMIINLLFSVLQLMWRNK